MGRADRVPPQLPRRGPQPLLVRVLRQGPVQPPGQPKQPPQAARPPQQPEPRRRVHPGRRARHRAGGAESQTPRPAQVQDGGQARRRLLSAGLGRSLWRATMRDDDTPSIPSLSLYSTLVGRVSTRATRADTGHALPSSGGDERAHRPRTRVNHAPAPDSKNKLPISFTLFPLLVDFCVCC